MYTTHGHHIDGTVYDSKKKPAQRARCGGPGLCKQCSQEANGVEKHADRILPPKEVTENHLAGRIAELTYLIRYVAPEITGNGDTTLKDIFERRRDKLRKELRKVENRKN